MRYLRLNGVDGHSVVVCVSKIVAVYVSMTIGNQARTTIRLDCGLTLYVSETVDEIFAELLQGTA